MCLGMRIDTIDISSPIQKDFQSDPFFIKHKSSNTKSITISKVLNLTQTGVYCSRARRLLSQIYADDDRCRSQNIAELLQRASEECKRFDWILAPVDVCLKVMIAYQKASQIFGPVLVDFAVTPITINLNDEQV